MPLPVPPANEKTTNHCKSEAGLKGMPVVDGWMLSTFRTTLPALAMAFLICV